MPLFTLPTTSRAGKPSWPIPSGSQRPIWRTSLRACFESYRHGRWVRAQVAVLPVRPGAQRGAGGPSRRTIRATIASWIRASLGLGEPFIVLAQAAPLVQPAEGAFHDPALR